jgi:hypothetical protein
LLCLMRVSAPFDIEVLPWIDCTLHKFLDASNWTVQSNQ